MMAAIFAALPLAFVSGWFGRRAFAFACAIACLLLSIGLFLFEIYSPETSFRMP